MATWLNSLLSHPLFFLSAPLVLFSIHPPSEPPPLPPFTTSQNCNHSSLITSPSHHQFTIIPSITEPKLSQINHHHLIITHPPLRVQPRRHFISKSTMRPCTIKAAIQDHNRAQPLFHHKAPKAALPNQAVLVPTLFDPSYCKDEKN
jgi:hypothetical protein